MNERELIAQIFSQFDTASPLLLKGIGDDCAVFTESDNLCWLASTDLLVENVHFVTKWHGAYALGRKSIAVNFSDIAAMGGKPRFILISLVIPSSLQEDWLQDWHDGVKSMLDEFTCVLIGGDVSKGEQLTINVTVLGTAHPDYVVYRSGASANQDIYITGELGSSAAGLELLKKGYNTSGEFLPLIQAHLDPLPKVEIGIKLGKDHLVTAMQDVSDGIATDLSHICKASNVSAIIDANKLPINGLVQRISSEINHSPLDLALFGGEDYQLIFTSSRENSSQIQKIAKESSVPITKIGETREGPAQVLLLKDDHTKDISFKGYEHS
jgi:thiamine-monophosphate kinase